MIEVIVNILSVLGPVLCLVYAIVCILLVWAACTISGRLARVEGDE